MPDYSENHIELNYNAKVSYVAELFSIKLNISIKTNRPLGVRHFILFLLCLFSKLIEIVLLEYCIDFIVFCQIERKNEKRISGNLFCNVSRSHTTSWLSVAIVESINTSNYRACRKS